MCQNNYIKEERKYKHLKYVERTMIERWHNKEGKSNKEIARLLDKNERTIRRELKRGFVITRTPDWIEREEYSADVAQEKYDYNLKGKGQELKIGSNYEMAKYIEQGIKEYKKSPEVLVIEGSLNINAKTIRNYIKKGFILDIKLLNATLFYTNLFKLFYLLNNKKKMFNLKSLC